MVARKSNIRMVIVSRVAIQSIEGKRALEQTCRLSHLSVRLSIGV